MDGKLYIVSGKQTRAAAEYLESRVDASDLRVAGDRTGLWNVREYLTGAAAALACAASCAAAGRC